MHKHLSLQRIPNTCSGYLSKYFPSARIKLIKINDAIFDHGKFHPKVVLTDAAKGFAAALEIMRKVWPELIHLLCRWHVYEAIRRHVAKYFKPYEKGQQVSAINRFIDAFRDVVCAANETQMRTLWRTLFEEGTFPKDAVEYVRREYYESAKAYKIMECYIFGAGNLNQTTTSRNEGSHAAFRSKTSVIPKPAEAYILRRKHNTMWMQRLRAKAADAMNSTYHDIKAVSELRDLIYKVSHFALSQIRQQVHQAKMQEMEGVIRNWKDSDGYCYCEIYRRYELPCWHVVPTDGSAIPLDSIPPFWRVDNCNQGVSWRRPF